jgi:hypothetical protein
MVMISDGIKYPATRKKGTGFIYKIRHKATGKFVRIKLEKKGIDIWVDKKVIEGNIPGYGNVLFKTHSGWSTPPNPSNEDFAKIGCEIVKYKTTLTEVK